MEAQQATTEVDSIEELSEGDTVTVTGNGLDITTEVSLFCTHQFMGHKQAMLAPANGYTATLSDTGGPLMTDGIKANVGAVTVELHE